MPTTAHTSSTSELVQRERRRRAGRPACRRRARRTGSQRERRSPNAAVRRRAAAPRRRRPAAAGRRGWPRPAWPRPAAAPASSSPSEAKAAVPSTTVGDARRRAPARGGRVPAQRERDRRRSRATWSGLDEQQRADLAEQQPGARQGRGAEPLEHAVAALEAGGDRQGGEGGRHDRQREHAGGEHVDRRCGRGQVEPVARPATPPISTSTGMTTASSSCSPLRSSSRVSIAAWASTWRRSGAAPGRGVKVPLTA